MEVGSEMRKPEFEFWLCLSKTLVYLSEPQIFILEDGENKQYLHLAVMIT